MELIILGPNQTWLRLSNGDEILFSYTTPVAGYFEGLFVRTSKFHSRTTSHHINAYLEGRHAVEIAQEALDSIVTAL